LTNLFLVAFGGALGASLRYATSLIFNNFFYYTFFGTLFVNILGSFLIGLLISFIQTKNISDDLIKYFFIIGLLGSYTTFSSFSLEVVDLFINSKMLLSITYILLSFILCILAAYIGLNIEKILN
tara:strand:+ start:335 stop:709 length:375 start_codon:yes stop_codon:yes gene_type:complete